MIGTRFNYDGANHDQPQSPYAVSVWNLMRPDERNAVLSRVPPHPDINERIKRALNYIALSVTEAKRH